MAFSIPPGFYGSQGGPTGDPLGTQGGPTGDPPGTSGKVRSPCCEGFGEFICLLSGYLVFDTKIGMSLIQSLINQMKRTEGL